MNRPFEDQLGSALADLASDSPSPDDLWDRTQHRIHRREARSRAAIAAGVLAVVAVVAFGVSRLGDHRRSLRVVTTPTTTSAGSNAPASTTAAPKPDVWSDLPATGMASQAGFADIGSFAVWTGREVITGEVGCCDSMPTAKLHSYDQAAKRWSEITLPTGARLSPAAVWTGTELLIAGGLASPDGTISAGKPTTDAAAYDPVTATWRSLAAAPVGFAAVGNPVWTGTEMLVVADTNGDALAPFVGLAYNPTTNAWRTIQVSLALERTRAATAWTGAELVVWGGTTGGNDAPVVHADGFAYDPSADTWRTIPAAPVPARQLATAVWTGHEVIVWGGDDAANVAGGPAVPTYYGHGAAYDPATNTWRKVASSPLKSRSYHSAVWTGHEMIVIGGQHTPANPPATEPSAASAGLLDGVAAYDPGTDTWRSITPPPARPVDPERGPSWIPTARADAIALWNGTEVYVLGGGDFYHQSAALFDLVLTPGR